MSHFEQIIAMLLILVRLFLVGIVAWFVVKEVRKSGRTGRKKQ